MSRLKKLIRFSWIRTLKIDILALFVSLSVATFACVGIYSYVRNISTIITHSKSTMAQSSEAVIFRIQNLQRSTEEILEDTSGLFIDNRNLSVHNPRLTLFMLNVVKFTPRTAAFFLAFESGNRILVNDLNLSKDNNSTLDPTKKSIPKNSAYIIQITDINQKPFQEIVEYRDHSFNVVGYEKFIKSTYNHKIQPWYLGAKQNKGLFWTDVYHYAGTDEAGISISKPIFNSDGTFKAVLGIDLSFVSLSNFLEDQPIGKSGRAYIVDQSGKLLIPEADDVVQTNITAKIIQEAFDYSKKENDNNFTIKINKIRYLVYISNIPSLFNKQWYIMTIVPFDDFFSDLIHTQIEIIIITAIILFLSIIIIILFSKRISKPVVKIAKEIDKITNLDLSSNERVHSHIIEIIMIDSSVANLRAAMHSFIKYVPKDIVKDLLKQGKEIALEIEKKNLTIFFSDIKSFTTITETHPLSILMPLLNNYLEGLSKIISENQGTIDKYIGDSIMAFWGAPLQNPNHTYFACKAALECQAFLTIFNKNCRDNNLPEFITRFGISVGTVVVGNIGTEERMNYTAIGDAVNTAARFLTSDKLYQVNIIISEDCYNKIKNQFLVRYLDTIEIRGKKEKMKIYELIAILEPNYPTSATPLQIELCQAFSHACEKFIDGHYSHAKELFEAIHRKFPEDYPTELYLSRLSDILRSSSQ